MEKMLLSGIYYAVEFLKTWLVSAGIFNIKYKKKVRYLFAASTAVISVITPWYNIVGNKPFVYVLCMYAAFMLSLEKKKNIGWVIFCNMVISIIDVVISCVIVGLYPSLSKVVFERPNVTILVNMISLFIFICVFCIFCKNRRKKDSFWKYNDALIGIVCAIVILILIAPLQMRIMGFIYKLSVLSTILLIVLLIVLIILLRIKKQREQNQFEKELAQELMKIQEIYYKSMLQKEEETKLFRHDVKEYIFCIQALHRKKDYGALDSYLNQIENRMNEFAAAFSTGNEYVDMILNNLAVQYSLVRVELNGKIPVLKMEELDICSLFYNLLKNAFEASNEAEGKELKMQVRVQETNMVLEISNQFKNVDLNENGEFNTTKEGEGHGYGLRSVKRCVEKYNGMYNVEVKDSRFKTEIVLPNIIEQ